MPNSPHIATSAYDLSALIDWYEAVGADCALEEGPQDRFEETKRQIAERQQARAKKLGQTPNEADFASSSHLASAMPAGAKQTDLSSRTGQNISNTYDKTFTSRSSKGQSPTFDKAAVAPAPQSSTTMPNAPALAGMGQQIEEARQRAQKARSLEELRQTLADFEGCSLKFSAKSLVFADGNPQARLMCIGEAPGREEDIQGLPFVGRAGQLLDKMLAAIGHDRSNSYITNILPWRPPGNRKPSLGESEMMQSFIHRHIELVNPDVLLFLGGTAAQHLLASKDGIMRLRGSWKSYAITNAEGQARHIPAMATLHPAFLLRTPAQKRAAWQDLLEVSARLSNT
ncbi:MAG: uracil-DNA glycosylase [Cohaesibacter sp.]|nr:uracil-DNA glycosylase [Cohaesibacter sp.]